MPAEHTKNKDETKQDPTKTPKNTKGQHKNNTLVKTRRSQATKRTMNKIETSKRKTKTTNKSMNQIKTLDLLLVKIKDNPMKPIKKTTEFIT